MIIKNFIRDSSRVFIFLFHYPELGVGQHGRGAGGGGEGSREGGRGDLSSKLIRKKNHEVEKLTIVVTIL